MEENFEIRNKGIEASLKRLGSVIGGTVKGTGYGFALLLFSLGEGGSMFYVSSAVREDMISSMKELIKKLEGGNDH